jgi:hypothetical protein
MCAGIRVIADDTGNTRTVAVAKANVLTSAGTKTIPEGTKIGGQYTNYITLSQTTEFETVEAGKVVYQEGMEIDCDHAPGTPNPCG